MAVSPADFELYSRATGTPLPRTPQEQMRLAPQVHSFIQNRGYQRGPVQRTAGALDNVIGGIRNTALIGAGLLGAGLAASAYANKRDSDSSGAVEPPKTPVGKGYTRIRPIPTRSKPVQAPVQEDSSSDPWEGSYSDGAITTVPPKMSTTGTIVTDLNRQPVEDTSNYTSSDALRGINSLWSTDGRQGGQRFAPGGRTRVGEDQYTEKPNFSSIKTAPTIFNPLGTTTIANPEVVGTDREGNPITSTPKAAFTDKPLQFPYPNRTNPGLAFIAASTEAPTTGLPLVDEISVPVISNLTGWHLPGIGQAVTTAGPYIAGLARQGAGDAVDTMRFAGSGLNYVSKNLRPILQQGKEDFSKGVRDIRTGAQDVDLVGRTVDQLKLAVAMKRNEDLGRIERGAQGVVTWAQKLRENEGRPLEGTNTVEIGGEHDLGDNPQFDDPGQQHEQISVAPSRGGQDLDSLITEVRARLGKDTTSEEVLSSLQTAIQTDGSSEEPEVAGTGTFEYPLDQALEPGNSVAVRRSELTPDMKLKAQFFDKPTKKDPTWREGKAGYEWDLATDDYMNPGESRENYSQRNKAKAKLGEFIANRMPATTEGKQSMGGLVNVVLDETSTAPNKLYNFAQKQGSSDWVRSPDGRLRKQNVVSEAGRGEREAATIDKARKFDMSEWSDDAGTPTESSETTAPSRQMSYTYPLQGNMTDEEYFNQGAFKIAKTAVDNPDFDSEAYYDNKKKWIQDQMD